MLQNHCPDCKNAWVNFFEIGNIQFYVIVVATAPVAVVVSDVVDFESIAASFIANHGSFFCNSILLIRN
jgi:hypothetical protein